MMPFRSLRKSRNLLFVFILSGVLTVSGTLSAKDIPKNLILSSKKKVVDIEVKRTQPLGDEYEGTSYGTGFIVDAEQGIIVTNRHVSGISDLPPINVPLLK